MNSIEKGDKVTLKDAQQLAEIFKKKEYFGGNFDLCNKAAKMLGSKTVACIAIVESDWLKEQLFSFVYDGQTYSLPEEAAIQNEQTFNMPTVKLKLEPPRAVQNFIRIKGTNRQLPISSLSQQEAEEYAEFVKQAWLRNYNNLTRNKK